MHGWSGFVVAKSPDDGLPKIGTNFSPHLCTPLFLLTYYSRRCSHRSFCCSGSGHACFLQWHRRMKTRAHGKVRIARVLLWRVDMVLIHNRVSEHIDAGRNAHNRVGGNLHPVRCCVSCEYAPCSNVSGSLAITTMFCCRPAFTMRYSPLACS